MRASLLCLVCVFLGGASLADAAEHGSWKGQRLVDYLDWLNDNGVVVIYTSDLVSDNLLVLDEPSADEARPDIESVLRPHGLAVIPGPNASLLVVRDAAATAIDGGKNGDSRSAVAPIPEIVVTSSLHRLEYSQSQSHTYFDRNLTTRIPAAAEEAVRLTARLPGTAGGKISSRNHVRGGEVNEVLFLLDGLRLYEPYHLKDFQSVASIVNVNAIAGMDVYTGAYPARFGDRMSGVIDIALRKPAKDMETELAVSFFNTSALSVGRFGGNSRGDWLFSARRGNLDLIVDVIDPDMGSPDYQDYLGHVGWDFGARAQVSANILVSKDKIGLFDDGRGERTGAAYENQVLWLKWLAEWSPRWSSEALLAISDISNKRNGILNLPGIVSGTLLDETEFDAIEFRQDWRFVASEQWMLQFGVNLKNLDAHYLFSSSKTVEEPFASLLENMPNEVRNFALSPGGAQYSVYSELRWRPHDKIAIDTGLRWDQQNYTTTNDDKQYSPRAGLLFEVNDRTKIRIGWGQFYQAQEINELQLSDGVDEFFPAQRAEHFVLNVKRNLTRYIDADLSIYRKSFRTLRPRFENMFNSLTLLPELQFDRVRVDAISAEAHGAELTLTRGTSKDDLLWWFSYGWSGIEDKTASGTINRSWEQTHTAKLGVSWKWGSWDFSAAGEAHTGWPASELIAETRTDASGNDVLFISATERNALRYSNFHSLDVRVSRAFDVRRGDLTLFLEVTNLYDRKNTCCTEYSIDGSASGASRLQVKERHWLPLVPSVGIVWRF